MSEALSVREVQSFRRAGDTATFLASVEANKLGRSVMVLADSHEALRAERDALSAVTQRLLHGWSFSEIVDGEGVWFRYVDVQEDADEELMTPAEAACVSALLAESSPAECMNCIIGDCLQHGFSGETER